MPRENAQGKCPPPLYVKFPATRFALVGKFSWENFGNLLRHHSQEQSQYDLPASAASVATSSDVGHARVRDLDLQGTALKVRVQNHSQSSYPRGT